MWEKDKELIYNYRQCMQNFIAEAKESNGEVEWEEACAVEGAKLQAYTMNMLDLYRDQHPQALGEARARQFIPRMPYSQNF